MVSLHASAAVDALVHVVVRVGVEAHVARELAHTALNGRGGRGCALPLELLVQLAKLELRGGALHRATEACPHAPDTNVRRCPGTSTAIPSAMVLELPPV